MTPLTLPINFIAVLWGRRTTSKQSKPLADKCQATVADDQQIYKSCLHSHIHTYVCICVDHGAQLMWTGFVVVFYITFVVVDSFIARFTATAEAAIIVVVVISILLFPFAHKNGVLHSLVA